MIAAARSSGWLDVLNSSRRFSRPSAENNLADISRIRLRSFLNEPLVKSLDCDFILFRNTLLDDSSKDRTNDIADGIMLLWRLHDCLSSHLLHRQAARASDDLSSAPIWMLAPSRRTVS